MKWEKLLSLERQVAKEKEPPQFERYPIDEVEKDYQEIISSAAFRRLQDKTQVFPLDKSDFVRTRLTHSIEVSTIARQLGIMITEDKTDYLPEEFKTNTFFVRNIPIVLSCAGLLHDIGNPPFGHFGEVVIGEWFQKEFQKDEFLFKGKPIRDLLSEQMRKDLENFEGNAQALRILSKARNNVEGYDINLSYGVLNALIKYPTSSVEFDKDDKDAKKHKLGYFYAERENMKTICTATGTLNGEEYLRHPLAYLMEAADDIAYATADLEDALKKGLFTLDEFVSYFEREVKMLPKSGMRYTRELLDDLERRITEKERSVENDLVAFQKWMVLVRKWLMYVVAFRFSNSYKAIMSGKYEADMFYDTFHQDTIEILKGAMKEFVYDDKEILKLELAAKKIISGLLNDFIYAVLYWGEETDDCKMSKADRKYVNIISANYKEDYEHARTEDEAENLYLRFLMVTDFISGMTDSFAKTLYQELNSID